jgi:uncharacterized membrane protein YeaQ/YmgE (transglycosylase-associated protein family)
MDVESLLHSKSSQRAVMEPDRVLVYYDFLKGCRRRKGTMGIIWTIIIGAIAGVVAKFIMPGNKNEPSGFIMTTILGIVGAFVASYLGQALGWYQAGEGAGLIGAIVGAVIVLFVWGLVARRTTA